MDYKHGGFAKHDHDLFVGQKIRTRGDIGGYTGTIVKIHNENYCQIKSMGKLRHMNMAFIEPRRTQPTTEKRG